MKNIQYSLLLSVSLFLFSCETLVEFDFPEYEQQLVVNSVINPDSNFTVDLSSSQSVATDHPYNSVTDATVQVYQAGQHLFNLQHKGRGKYQADQKPATMQNYELRVSAPSHPPVKAVSHVPVAPQLHKVKATRVPSNTSHAAGIRLSFVLEDEPQKENYYYIQAFTPDKDMGTGKVFNRAISVQLISPIDFEFSMENRWFFSDKLFNGESLPMELFLEHNQSGETYIQVAHITKEYYDYVRTLEKQSYRDNFGVMPIPVSNNIINGMGLFAGYDSAYIKIMP